MAGRQIGQLSGGQRQRALLARTLMQDAPLLLLDEPLSGADAATEAAFLETLRRLRDEGRTVLVSHPRPGLVGLPLRPDLPALDAASSPTGRPVRRSTPSV